MTIKNRPPGHIATLEEPNGPSTDRLRLLRMRLWELRNIAPLRTVLVSSPLPEDGKSTIATNIAIALADGGNSNVLLLEADLHRPSIAHLLGIESTPGLAECLETEIDPLSVIVRVEPLSLYLMQAGSPVANGSDLVQGDALGTLMQTLSKYFDWIVIDTPPVVALTDALSLAKHADTSLLVVRSGKTPRAAVEEAMNLMGPKQVMGIILNGDDESTQSYSRYGRYYNPA